MIAPLRPVIVAANWKMHTTPADAGELARTIAARTREPDRRSRTSSLATVDRRAATVRTGVPPSPADSAALSHARDGSTAAISARSAATRSRSERLTQALRATLARRRCPSRSSRRRSEAARRSGS